MTAEEFQDLLHSITNIGIQNPITLFEGMVLDGWNRYCASSELGYDCPTVELGDVDARAFVLAQNASRRNLSASQRALAAATCYQWRPVGNPQFRSTSELQKQTAVAAAARVSDATLRQAKQVVDHGVVEVQEAVRAGHMPVERAAEIAKLPKEEQGAALSAPKTAKSIGKAKKLTAVNLADAEIKLVKVSKPDEGAEEKAAALEAEVAALREQFAEATDDIASMSKVLDAGDPLATALAEAKTARDLARALQQRVNSMLTEIAELTRTVKFWQKKAGQPA